ncbi:MAG: DEAD/DEAH box helicase, partial [Acidobacteria bacterium]|nr:DEAD/DEAH box helicase [Acidobacteriota bacterium]
MAPSSDPLSAFDPLVRSWFSGRFAAATEIQEQAWPAIARGESVLLTAPTGSGKTLTAFLWALDRLLVGAWPKGSVRVLYVSPLKALNYDIERNQAAPLKELTAAFQAAGRQVPEIRVQTRSGDTPGEERQRMLRRPPEILITTPESLNILLTSRGGRRLLGDLETVILDEVHAVAGSKRGAHLMSAVDRLVPLSGDFQRIAISATIRPLARIAEMVGGYRAQRRGDRIEYRRRPVTVLASRGQKEYRLQVCAAPPPPEATAKPGVQDVSVPPEDAAWTGFAERFRSIVHGNRSTLFFANSRRLTEKMTRLINEGLPRDLAYSHHGSLSREIRSVVESRLKNGELAAIVATNSLELGIDIGDLDEVVLIQTPPSVSSAVQRIGRSGHGVGEVSRSRLFPTHGRDALDAAVVVRCVLDQDIEEVQPVECPLDVLAQVIASMVAAEPWSVDELYDFLRTSYPFHTLKRRSFDLVLAMLAGRYADSRLRELSPRVSIDRVEGMVKARDGLARLIYSSGGTIPDRGYYALRQLEGQGKLGELDEEFVWERSVGDTFTLGAQSWRIERITHNDVLVTPARSSASLAPFWRADERDRGFHLSSRIGRFLRWADANLREASLVEDLRRIHFLEKTAAEELVSFLREQREVTGCSLPHDGHLVVEHYTDPYGGGRRPQVLIHTFWGGKVNRPLAIALAQAIEETTGNPAEVLHNNDSINVVLPEEGARGVDVLGLVDVGNLEKWLRRRLERTGFFGARFRHNAARALLLPRPSFKRRMPLWLTRLRSKKLLEAVSRYEDFPVVAETWRTCLKDDFDLDSLFSRLAALKAGEIEVSEVHTTAPSPFAADLIWKQTNLYMYDDDTPDGSGASKLSGDLLRELVFSSRLRPRLSPRLVAELESKLQRLAPGYAPRPGLEL